MVIDFHAHIFPDTLAPRAVKSLTDNTGGLYSPCTDGTAAGLTAYMDECGVDISVVQPVATKPTQITRTNEWAVNTANERLIFFGAFHPDTDDYKRDIDHICALGFKGIKLHAEYQDFQLDEPKMLKIYDYAFSRGLIILQHAGFDPAYKPPFRTSPKQFANVAKQMQGGIMIAAHFGGHDQWDDVEKYIVGTNIYIDTSMGFSYYKHEQFLRIVKSHGSDKVLFATDSPWSRAEEEIAALESMELTRQEKDNIFYKNAKRILNV
ncbi:MAG: hypothetical protein E7491_07535 [Ruminococcaceae bacterium]|nr:hypothetical protein [Oscillospiraceae bacterium]